MKYMPKLSLSLIALAAVLPVLSGCDSDNNDGGGAPPGSSFLVAVAKAGSGQGRVTSTPTGIDCGFDCAQNYSTGTNVTLVAQPDPGNSFAGWSGVVVPGAACGTGTNCFFSVTADVNAVATFVANTGPGTLGEVVAVNVSNELISFRRDTPNSIQTRAAVTLNAAQAEQLVGVDYRPGDTGTAQAPKIYGLVRGTTTSRVIAINPVTGAISQSITLVADTSDATAPYLNLTGTNFGMDFNPVANRLRIVSDTGENLRVRVTDDPATAPNEVGFTTTDTPLNGAAIGATGAAYTSNFAGAPGTVLMLIADDNLLIQDPPNDGTTTLVAALNGGVSDIGAIAGFDITGDGDFNTLGYLAATDTNGAGNTEFYEVNLFNGATTFKGAIGLGTEVIRGVAVAPAQPQLSTGDAFALTSDNRLLSFNRAVPGSGSFALRTGVNISGLQAGEDVIGIDHRLVDGVLYAIGKNGSAGRVYTLNPSSGLATFIADITDTSSNAISISGSAFGVSFRPTTDRIRILSNTAQNLTVRVDTGSEGITTVNPNLTRDPSSPSPTRPTVGITTSAFSPGLAGVDSATHFVLDFSVSGGVLATVRESAGFPDGVNDPAGEVVTRTYKNPADPTGNSTLPAILGVTAGVVNGLDLDPITGIMYAALRVDTDNPPNGPNSLFTVDLTTGAVGKLGVIGGGTIDIEGLSFAPPTGPFVYGVITEADGQKLVKFSPTYPSDFIGKIPITDQNGDQIPVIEGIDFKPVAGVLDSLYALTKEAGPPVLGKIWVIDPVTGRATPLNGIAMVASPEDPTSPFAGFGSTGLTYGVDFNPSTASGLADFRIVSNIEENLRVSAISGHTFTDSNLNLNGAPNPSFVIAGAAYGNNFPGVAATGTVLHVINIQDGGGKNATVGGTGGAGGGVSNAIGPSPIVQPDEGTIISNSKVGFDIVGPDDIVPLASFLLDHDANPATAGVPYLYVLDLDNIFPSTQLGSIGPSGTPALQGLAIQLEPVGN